jgi:hypothetical protein
MTKLSPLRARMASFEHAYAVAIQCRHETGADQYIVRTDEPSRPFRVTWRAPSSGETLMVRVV